MSTGLIGSTSATLEKQTLAGIATKDFYFGLWGVGPRPTNLTSLDNPYPSMMTNLKVNNVIPSTSYGYTAGARYRKLLLAEASYLCLLTIYLEQKQVAGSLTLGGYDVSRFKSHTTTFTFAGDVSRDLVVGVQSIAVNNLKTTKSLSPVELLPQPILSFIDPGESHIWLPQSSCDQFASAFGLQYDPVTELYLVNDTTHRALQEQNATLVFQITADLSSTSKTAVIIDFPYAAFDLELTSDYPGINSTTPYFPIRRAANDTQYTLGRTFLQQAYIIADYERSTFSVHPCVFSENAKQELRPILPPGTTHHSFTPGIIATIACSSIVGILAITLVAFKLGQRRHSGNVWRERKSRPFKWLKRYIPCVRKPKAISNPPKAHEKMNDDLLRREELDGDCQHPLELAASWQGPGELSAHSIPPQELEGPGDSRGELPQVTAPCELEAGSVFSYTQTPLSKEGFQ